VSNAINYAFIHGGGQGGWVWGETIAALERQAGGDIGRVVALDAPGCGEKRERRTEDLSIEDVARELTAELESVHMRDVILVGHSQAGQAMIFMAKIRPELFRRFVYVSCSAPLPGQSVLQMIGGGLQGANSSEVGWPLDPKTSSVAERYSLMFCNDMREPDKSEFLAKLGKDMWPLQTYTSTSWTYDHLDLVPATFVLCLKDLSLPPAWQEIFAARLKARKIVRIDAGHQAMNTRPETLAEILRYEANDRG
jgi:pimeloyl-ACP methyl ester carboxylesterase